MKIREVYTRYRKSRVPLLEGESFRSSTQIFKAFRDQFLEPVEVFRVVYLDGKNRMLCFEEIGRGTLTSCLVHPREVFSTAVRLRCAGIIAIHNHPSGDPAPSAEDIQITKRLQEAGQILGIRLLDHLIVGEHRYFSFADQGPVHMEAIAFPCSLSRRNGFLNLN